MEQLLMEEFESDETTAIDAYTAEEVIESMKWGRFQLFVLFIAGVFTMVDACEVMLLTVLFPAIQCEWQLSSLQAAMLSMLVFTGMLCGSSLWGTLSDKYGRKPIIYSASALVAFFGFLCSFSPSISWLLLLRFLVGAAISGNIQMSVLMVEFVGSRYRAVTVVAQQGFWAAGALLEVLMAWMIVPTIGWRYLVAMSAVPLTLALFTWPIVPESVRYLLVSGQKAKATQTLNKATLMNRCSLPPGELDAQVVKERGRIADLFRPEYRRTTLHMIVIWATSISGYYGTSLATTELLTTNYCDASNGTVPSSPHVNATDNDSGCSPLTSSEYGRIAITSVAELLIMPFAILLADKIGRRRSMTVCQLAVAVPYFVLLTCVGSTRGVTMLLFVARGFAASVTTIIYLYTPEVYPTRCRAVGLSCCYIAGRIGAILTPLLSQVLLRASVHSALIVYGIISVTGAIASFLLPIETLGRRMN